MVCCCCGGGDVCYYGSLFSIWSLGLRCCRELSLKWWTCFVFVICRLYWQGWNFLPRNVSRLAEDNLIEVRTTCVCFGPSRICSQQNTLKSLVKGGLSRQYWTYQSPTSILGNPNQLTLRVSRCLTWLAMALALLSCTALASCRGKSVTCFHQPRPEQGI